MRLGRKIGIIAAALAVLAAPFSGEAVQAVPAVPRACAEELAMPELFVEASLSPDRLVEPGEATLYLTMTNLSGKTLQNVSLTSADGLVRESLSDVEPGVTQDFSFAHSVTAGELAAGKVHYVVTCTTGAGLFSYPVSAAVQQTLAEPEVEFSRRISNEYVAAGDSVVVVYELRNVGNIDVHGVTLTDPLGTFSEKLDTLSMGETRTFLNRTVPADGSVSAPVLEYVTGTERENNYVTRLDEVVLSTAINLLDVDFSVEESLLGADSAEVTLALTNGGNADYHSVTIYDDVYGGIIADSLVLPAGGGPVVCTNTYPLRGEQSFRWRITGVNEAGERIDLFTETLKFESAEPVSPARLSLTAEASMTRINRPGYVPFTLTIENTGDETASHVQISEATLGDVYELAVVPSGEPTAIEVRYPVRENTTFAFTARYTDNSGTQHTLSARPIEVAIVAGGERPEPIENTNTLLSGVSVQMGESPLFVVMLITSSVVLVVLFVVLLVTSRRARKIRRERAAARKQRLKEELGKTNRFKPVKRPAAKK